MHHSFCRLDFFLYLFSAAGKNHTSILKLKMFKLKTIVETNQIAAIHSFILLYKKRLFSKKIRIVFRVITVQTK